MEKNHGIIESLLSVHAAPRTWKGGAKWDEPPARFRRSIPEENIHVSINTWSLKNVDA